LIDLDSVAPISCLIVSAVAAQQYRLIEDRWRNRGFALTAGTIGQPVRLWKILDRLHNIINILTAKLSLPAISAVVADG
jgi:hypothetical protein